MASLIGTLNAFSLSGSINPEGTPVYEQIIICPDFLQATPYSGISSWHFMCKKQMH